MQPEYNTLFAPKTMNSKTLYRLSDFDNDVVIFWDIGNRWEVACRCPSFLC